MWACTSHPLFVAKGGSILKIPDSILRQAKDASLPVTMRIGKSGLTDAVVVELEGQLSSRTLVKAKVNRGLFPREEMKQVWGILQTKHQVTLFLLGVMWLCFGRIDSNTNPTLNKVMSVQTAWAVVFFSRGDIQHN